MCLEFFSNENLIFRKISNQCELFKLNYLSLSIDNKFIENVIYSEIGSMTGQ